ncbi:MAG: hypothetical protein KKA05_11250 [Alphaproteobacteria bacterium]|nr:hypothetical protein [Alphaproteobacteria bacterium]
MPTYQELQLETEQLCSSIENSPQARLAVRQAFYQQYGFQDKDGLNFGDSEIAFLKWEIRRGVLNPLTDSPQPGSAWWRNVNLRFIYFSELAGKMYANHVTYDKAPMALQHWLAYLQKPTSESWYRAHNTSILAGFDEYKSDAISENEIEQLFLNITLYRLMFAQALVEDATIFGDIGRIIANPKDFSVKLITSLPDFYPTHYPLTEQDKPIIEGREYTIEDHLVYVMDNEIILPHIVRLYQEAANWNSAPFLVHYLNGNVPCYPF